jgi:hypothetical protein
MNPCTCPLYTFPHRRSDRCEDYEMEAKDAAKEIEMARYLFDKAESDAINLERMRG